LRDDPRTRDLEVVVVTGHDAAQTSERLHDLRVRECLPKPIVVARLLELLDEVGETDAGPA
jgi:CheY-like chemotaxis protein